MSAVVEMLIGCVDYQQMAALFRARAPMDEIVLQTGHTPAMIRAIRDEFARGDLYSEQTPALPALPAGPPRPRLVKPARKGA